ncbi:hypothetical protein L7F22_021727 [Adiantum nelumboides]|nr:hypothetical protein [Adiantum nelumboides]
MMISHGMVELGHAADRQDCDEEKDRQRRAGMAAQHRGPLNSHRVAEEEALSMERAGESSGRRKRDSSHSHIELEGPVLEGGFVVLVWFANVDNCMKDLEKGSLVLMQEAVADKKMWELQLRGRYDEQLWAAGSNLFTGSIPTKLSKCKNLSILDLDTNSLSGNVPGSLSEIPNLHFLVLHSNFIDGSIPSCFFNASGLKFLDLSNNSISGSISSQFINLTSLQFLLLANNQFSGEIPPELGALTGLVFLDLSTNKLQGPISSSFAQLQNLLWLMLAYNNLTGVIPPQLGNCTSLLWLNLRSNELTGNLPPELATMGQDPQRSFTINAKTINPPRALGECLLIKRWLPENFNPYSFMYDILDKTRCKSLWIEFLTAIPSIFACGQTPGSGGYIQLTNNKFTGNIPSSYQGNKLSMLLLSGNLFTGEMPDGLGKLPLRHLNLSRNFLSGPISSSLSDTRCLALLDLSYNNLSGPLPSSLGNLSQLFSFNVSYNPSLTGNIPASAQFLTFGLNSYLGNPLLCYDSMAGRRKEQNSSSTTLPFCGSQLNTTTQPDSEAIVTGNSGSFHRSWFFFVFFVSFVFLDGEAVGVQVYEQWELGGLATRPLYDREGGAETLTWARRVKIASNCTRALSYLHHECASVLIHRDMKASNVLLDEEFNGYLADFGLTREIDDGNIHVSTVVAGTLGYLVDFGLAREIDDGYTHVSIVVAGTLGYVRGYVPPEYCQTWRATTKGDVYSFGVVMLELITSRHPISMFPPIAKRRDEELLLFLELAQACTLEVPEKRPSMKMVAKNLESLVFA